MFIRGCSLDCIVSIVCVPYLVNCWANCIVLLSFQYWTIVLCGHICLCSILKRFEHIHSKFCSLIPATQMFCAIHWLNVEGSILLILFTKFFTTFHQLTYEEFLIMLQLLPPMLEETVISFLYQESGLHVVRIVSTIRVHKSGTP